MPRNYIRRRRIRRTLANTLVVVVFGTVIGWVITRQSPTPSFAIRDTGQNDTALAFDDASERTRGQRGKYPYIAGRYEIQDIADALVRDANRDVEIHVRVTFPKSRSKFPVILFLPDNRDSPPCCEPLLRDWASHGYVIVQLARGALVHTEERGELVQTVRFKRAVHTHMSAAQAATRALDVTSVIDSFSMLQTQFPELRGKLDGAHIGVVGDASGAVAVEAIAGALLQLPGQSRSNLADPRVRAVICISPQGPGQSGLTEESFDHLILPYLGVTSDRDAVPPKYDALVWHKAPFARSQPGEKYQLFLLGDSTVFPRGQESIATGSRQTADLEGLASTYIHAATLAFWDAYLKHDLTAKGYLQSGALQKASTGKVILERR